MLKNERHVRAGLAAAGQSEREDEGAVMSSSLSIGDDGRSMRLGEVSTGSGGGSRLAKTSIGSAAVQAALTLHPCVHVQGCGDASESAMHALLSSVGPCRIRMYRDEETGESEGELSCTYDNAAAAAAAIERFDGSRFDDGYLIVTVAKTAAQGSLTRRGRGRNADKLTHFDRAQLAQRNALADRAQSEKDAFSAARAAASEASRAPLPPVRDAFTPAPKPAEAAAAAAAAPAKKRVAPPSRLPNFVVKKGPAACGPGAAGEGAPAAPAPAAAAAPAPAAAGSPDGGGGAAPEPGGLLGLGAYGSDSDEE